jgi:hypothetical protein
LRRCILRSCRWFVSDQLQNGSLQVLQHDLVLPFCQLELQSVRVENSRGSVSHFAWPATKQIDVGLDYAITVPGGVIASSDLERTNCTALYEQDP